MKQLLILLIIPILIIGQNNKSSLISESLQINDSESINFSQIMQSLYDTPKENIVNSSFFKFKSPALIRSFSTNINDASDFGEHINRIQEGRYLGYWNTLTENIYNNRITECTYAFPIETNTNTSSYDWDKIKGYRGFYKKMFDNKKARRILFEAALDITLYWCNNLPKDFCQHIITEIGKLKNFTEKIEEKSMNSLKNMNHSNLNNYWEGFIIRRILNNNVKIKEVQELLDYAEKELNKIDFSKLDAAIYRLSMNKSIEILVYRSYYSLYSQKSGKEIIMRHNEVLKEIKYFTDETSDYYVFITRKNNEEHRTIYDENLNLID